MKYIIVVGFLQFSYLWVLVIDLIEYIDMKLLYKTVNYIYIYIYIYNSIQFNIYIYIYIYIYKTYNYSYIYMYKFIYIYNNYIKP